MDSNLLFKELKHKVSKLFRADQYHIEVSEIVSSESLTHNEKHFLETDSIYYLTSASFDIPTTATLYLSGENNFISTSKEDWEFENQFRMEAFRNYIHIRTENGGTTAFQFKLKFLKVTPYRNN